MPWISFFFGKFSLFINKTNAPVSNVLHSINTRIYSAIIFSFNFFLFAFVRIYFFAHRRIRYVLSFFSLPYFTARNFFLRSLHEISVCAPSFSFSFSYTLPGAASAKMLWTSTLKKSFSFSRNARFRFAFSRVTLSTWTPLTASAQHVHTHYHCLLCPLLLNEFWQRSQISCRILFTACSNVVFVLLFHSFVDLMMGIHLGYYFITCYLFFVLLFGEKKTHKIVLRHFLFDCTSSV